MTIPPMCLQARLHHTRERAYAVSGCTVRDLHTVLCQGNRLGKKFQRSQPGKIELRARDWLTEPWPRARAMLRACPHPFAGCGHRSRLAGYRDGSECAIEQSCLGSRSSNTAIGYE